MSSPLTASSTPNNELCARCNGSRHASAPVEEVPEFSGLYTERVLQDILDHLRNLDARLEDLSGRLPAAPEFSDCEFVGVRVMLISDSDYQLLKDLGEHGVLVILHNLGGSYLQIKSVKFIPKPKAPIVGPDGQPISARLASILLTFRSYEAEDEVRKNSAKLVKDVGISPNCFILDRLYQVHVVGFEKDQNMGMFPDWTEFFRHHTNRPDIRVRVRFNRFLIETACLQTALLICRMSIKIGNTTFKATPFARQGTPMFCYTCNTPGHFYEVCGSDQPRCGRCSEPHTTASCQSGDRLKCCNCLGPHAAWDHRCTDKKAQREHSKASYHRKAGPFWARWVNSEDSSSASKKQANPGPENTEEEPQKRQRISETSKTSSTSTTPSTKRAAKKQTGPKRGPGRPPLSASVCDDPRQTSILQYGLPSPATASTTTASKQAANEPPSATPDTLGDTVMADTEAAASPESVVAQGHHGNGGPVVESQPTTDKDMDMADYTMADSQGSTEPRVPVSGSASDTTDTEKKKKVTGKTAALERDETQERARGSEGTKPQEKSTSKAKALKDQAQRPGNNNNNNNTKKKTKDGKMKNQNDAKRQGGGAATSQGNNTGSHCELDTTLDSNNGVKEVAQGTLTTSGNTGPGKGKGKGKGRGKGKGKARNGAKSPEKDVDMDIDTMMD